MVLTNRKPDIDTPSLLLALSIYFIGVVLISSVIYIVSRQAYMEEIDTRLMAAAKNLPAILPTDFHDRAVSAESITIAEDRINMNQLSKHAATGGFAYLYTYIIKKNTVYFTASNYTTSDVKYNTVSHYWTDYREAKPVFWTAMQSDGPLFDTYSDRWGTFRTVLIPFQSPNGNHYVAAADMEISIIERSLRWRVLVVIIISVVMLALALPFIRVFTRTYAAMNSELMQLNRELNRDIERSRKIEETLRQHQE